MKLKKYAYLYFKTAWKLYFKNNEKIPGNLLKNLEKSWKYHGILSVRKSGNPVYDRHLFTINGRMIVKYICDNLTSFSLNHPP